MCRNALGHASLVLASLVLASLLTVSSQAFAGGERVLLVGADGFEGVYGPVGPSLVESCFDVVSLPAVADLDGIDLDGIDLVWLTNGVSPSNPNGSGQPTVPSESATEALVAFLVAGGALFVPGEYDSWSNPLLVWRDALLTNALGAGVVDGICQCDSDDGIMTVASHPTSFEPNLVPLIGTTSPFNGGFELYGTGTPIAHPQGQPEAPPNAVAWPPGSMAKAPAGSVISFNNMNNDPDDFAAWAVNAASFLVQRPVGCPADLDGDALVGFGDLLAVLGAWGSADPCENVTPDDPVGFDDLVAVLAAWGPCD